MKGFEIMNIEFVRQISASDILNWMLAFISGIVVYKIVDHMQTNIERHSIIKDIESTINSLFSSPLAKSNCILTEANSSKLSKVNFRTVLHDNTPWEYFKREKESEETIPNIIIEDQQRYVRIRSKESCTEYISTQALHETLIIFRRIEKLYKDGILKPIDLADMWREILPFGTSGRLIFFSTYFCSDDVHSIAFVVYNTVLACKKYKLESAICYFKEEYRKERLRLQEINMTTRTEKKLKYTEYFFKNKRYSIKEKMKIRRFKNIIEDI